MKPPVSIVIPMYNAERHMRKVVEAILNQDYPGPVEIIVVNDGSTDKSLEIVKEFQQTDNLKVINQQNQGAVVATNNGFKAASHDITCSVESDAVPDTGW